MKRDWDLIRRILLQLEGKQSTNDVLKPEEVEGHSEEEVCYHIRLLHEAGLVGMIDKAHTRKTYACFATRLTWDGHEFLDQARSDTVWKRAQSFLKEKGISLSLEALRIALGRMIEGMLGSP